MGSEGEGGGEERGGGEVLCEASAVDAHHNKGIGYETVGLLKGAHVFVSSGLSVL